MTRSEKDEVFITVANLETRGQKGVKKVVESLRLNGSRASTAAAEHKTQEDASAEIRRAGVDRGSNYRWSLDPAAGLGFHSERVKSLILLLNISNGRCSLDTFLQYFESLY